jgi:hypothetical protein
MKLEKAIKVIQNELDAGSYQQDQEFEESLKLGIEALKDFDWWRKHIPAMEGVLLPGETKE